ncbi:hypothetical protein B0H13DRAFT_1910624 [Mycena leptocephala]|nr:hypothetical protein B0H13DRAFT_1910624 [Mycena leptocephala]
MSNTRFDLGIRQESPRTFVKETAFELTFVNNPESGRIENRAGLATMMRIIYLFDSGTRNILEKLDNIVITELRELWVLPTEDVPDRKKLNVIVVLCDLLTDPAPLRGLENSVEFAAKSLADATLPDDRIGIQFVQVGFSRRLSEALKDVVENDDAAACFQLLVDFLTHPDLKVALLQDGSMQTTNTYDFIAGFTFTGWIFQKDRQESNPYQFFSFYRGQAPLLRASARDGQGNCVAMWFPDISTYPTVRDCPIGVWTFICAAHDSTGVRLGFNGHLGNKTPLTRLKFEKATRTWINIRMCASNSISLANIKIYDRVLAEANVFTPLVSEIHFDYFTSLPNISGLSHQPFDALKDVVENNCTNLADFTTYTGPGSMVDQRLGRIPLGTGNVDSTFSRPPDTPRVLQNSLDQMNPLTTHHPRLVKIDGYGPPLYEAASVASSVIYWPENNNGLETAETDSIPGPSAGLEELKKCLPNGGIILSVYQPATSLAWLEENHNMPIMKFIRNHEIYSGPVAMMLFPDTSAIAIFGPHSEEKMAKLAQKLANISNFPVIARPAPDDPMFRFNSLTGTDNNKMTEKLFTVEPVVVMTAQIQDGVEGNIRNVGTADNTLNTEGQSIGAGFPNSGPDEVGGIGSADGTNRHGGDGDPGDEGDSPGHDDKWEDWFKTYAELNMSHQIQMVSNGADFSVGITYIP